MEGGYKRVAMQFPDEMLGDAPRVSESLEAEVFKLLKERPKIGLALEKSFEGLEVEITGNGDLEKGKGERVRDRTRFYILADTSYGSCCVDEIAAEHISADVVIHYGRSCLSPTARLPVIYIFTSPPLDLPHLLNTFEHTFPEKEDRVVLMADICFHTHISTIRKVLDERGYRNLLVPGVIHDPGSRIPNRDVGGEVDLKEYKLFHVGNPVEALLLTLNSRVKELFIFPAASTTSNGNTHGETIQKAIRTNTTMTLRRRYALLTSLSTCPIFGILINTLSVKNYLSTATSLRNLIAAAGKKSYTFVVGKINAAKIANFAEVGGWVVVGCWESSLIENGEFYKPVITPFELGLVLVGDGRRVWDGDWRGDFGGVEELGRDVEEGRREVVVAEVEVAEGRKMEHVEIEDDEDEEEEESEPPEFDLRTGRYVSHSRPMRSSNPVPATSSSSSQSTTAASNVLTRRAKGDLATVNGAVSPGAEYLRSQRTWTGLGSDFHEEDAGMSIEEGRSGVARGYTVGESERR